MPLDERGCICDTCGEKVDVTLVGPKGFPEQLKAMKLGVICAKCREYPEQKNRK